MDNPAARASAADAQTMNLRDWVISSLLTVCPV
ncbi:hypothetical protein NK6_7576 [Bradyrhizobium diazoefficiens]|uniref:Uncharacterized protein n=1 Tax=Bradyrhizobium diazoefficiens TaxID=1355477 RepID=A0A0E4BTY0_9BRAD|nr:hypothetical protein NK6_7576 [Bradyrhizobium diazoefficiens]